MKHKGRKVYAMIPARYGSTRLQMKNLALINGRPMISYAINAALESGVFDRVIVNSEHKIFNKISDRYGVEFYKRPNYLGSSETKSDDVVADFMNKHNKADIVAWVNPTSPLQTSDEIKSVVEYFIDKDLDSLITVEDKQVHTIFNGEPVNYSIDGNFSQTQDLAPVQPFVYSVMMWKTKIFLHALKTNQSALFCGKFDTFAVDKMTGLIIKTKEDLLIVDSVLKSRKFSTSNIDYDHVINQNKGLESI